MADAVQLREEDRRGTRAAKIIEDAIFIEACQRARDDILLELEQTRWDDRERREFLDKELRALKRVVAYLKLLMINGEAARKKLHEPSRLRRAVGGR